MNNPLAIFRRNGSSPLRTLSRLQTDFDRFFEEFSGMEPRNLATFEFSPSCELSEENGKFMLKFDMPGVKREDVKIELDQNQLTVSAERKQEKKSEGGKDYYSEISYGSYARSFALPSGVDDKKVEATFKDGVLTVTLPKVQNNKAKQIAIQ